MYKYILKRVLLMIPTLFGAAVLVFIMLRLIPGDICQVRMGEGTYFDQAAIDTCREETGTNQPLLTQFGGFVWGLMHFDFGTSMWTGHPVLSEVALRFELSLQIAIMATLIGAAIAIPLGTISAVKQNTWIDYFVRGFSIAGIATPSFWLGIIIILGILMTTQHLFGTPWMPPIKYDAARKELAQWIVEGKMKRKEHFVKGGLERAPSALVELFEGANTGKMMVEIAPVDQSLGGTNPKL
jgi:peptide/nickel transport system permease protein